MPTRHSTISSGIVSSAELRRRQQLCTDTVIRLATTARHTACGGHLAAPDIEFLPRGKIGFYHRVRNRVSIGEERFLSVPSTSDAAIAALLGHELGHWADARFRREAMYAAVAIALATVCFLVVIPAFAFGNVGLGLMSLMCGVVGLFVLTPLLSWKSEYRADRFASSAVGADAVVELLDSLPGRHWPSPTHPSPARRSARIRARFGTNVRKPTDCTDER